MTTGSVLLWAVVVVAVTGAQLVESAVRQRARARVERTRQLAVTDMLRGMPSSSVVLFGQLDGAITVLVRGQRRAVEKNPRCGEHGR